MSIAWKAFQKYGKIQNNRQPAIVWAIVIFSSNQIISSLFNVYVGNCFFTNWILPPLFTAMENFSKKETTNYLRKLLEFYCMRILHPISRHSVALFKWFRRKWIWMSCTCHEFWQYHIRNNKINLFFTMLSHTYIFIVAQRNSFQLKANFITQIIIDRT